MKVIKKEIKKCEETSGNKLTVLDLEYTHRGEKGRILIRDYKDKHYSEYLKQLRVAVREAYNTKQEQGTD